MVTDRLADALRSSNLTGWELSEALVTRSQLFDDLSPDVKLPRFWWFIPTGTLSQDFSVSSDGSLSVSERALHFLKGFNLDHARVVPLDRAP
jgi:hypothetical protein